MVVAGAAQLRAVAARPVAFTVRHARRANASLHVVRAEPSDEERAAAVKAALEQAQANPEMAAKLKQMEQAVSNPEVQAQMSSMMGMMSNPAFMQKMQELREDPELKPVFEEIRAGGMAAMMKYFNDPTFLQKIGEKMGDLEGMAAPAAPAAPPPPPEVNSILDAAKFNDVEAIEDYMAIGKGDLKDGQGRSALHYAVAYDRPEAVQALLQNGFDVDAAEAEGNTSLHYAAGYGRESCVRMLLQAGANVGLRNGKGQTPADVVRGEPRNPLNQDASLLAVLDGTAELATIQQ